MAEVTDADSDQPGILQVSCRGTRRFRITATRQRPDGLWLAGTEPLADDALQAPAPELLGSVRALQNMVATLKGKDAPTILPPHRFDDAGWVANRWCEVLPISRAAKQKLMELDDPGVRLQLVDEFLRSKGLVG